MSGTILRLLSLAFLIAALCFVAAGRPRGSYYPLEPGMAWEYEVSTPGTDAPPVRVTVRNEGRRRIGEWDATSQKMEISGGGNAGYRYAVEKSDFIAMVGEQRPGQNEPSVIDPPQLLLRLPAAVGQSWTSEALSTRINPGTKIPVQATIESVSEKINVPAGVFSDCVHVRSTGSVRSEAAADGNAADVQVENQLWYARGVGIVRIERKETSSRAGAATVGVTYQLMGRSS